ncbi:hypothetical protein jhhlp_002951 [Lomentospora prolificans]|uniref:Zn(2)-C6 fungal-type domain-containing protein n=1 Tax=Lomentospora prolificans TaxID=41688 RepID=A0A2N3NFG8_9PEZI|nr:hypothetical protein jhhlp_002951 [Lomentospora prolificans]
MAGLELFKSTPETEHHAYSWPGNPSMSSEDSDCNRVMMPRSPSSPRGCSGQSTTTVIHTGQLSPVSPGMDLQDPDSEPSPVLMSPGTSSYPSSWPMDSLHKAGSGTAGLWTQQESDGLTMIPKVEIADDELDMSLLSELPAADVPDASPKREDVKPKRPRGRPRKHPLTSAINTNKVTKGRSKTGCITCRKRKKKCDEAKPRCLNCEKNAVVCEGYHEKQIWKSGKEKAEEARLRKESLPVITMQPLFHGVETTEDKIFWKHYCTRLSNVLTVEGEHQNAFKDIVLQVATRHKGLMHSILALSSKHIDYATPYGAKILQDCPNVSTESLQDRAEYHHEQSMKCFYEDISKSSDKNDSEHSIILTARYGQMLCLLLQTLVEGNPRGEHRVHLQAYKNLIKQSPPDDPSFLSFITEFFEYHIFADELLSCPSNSYGRSGADPSTNPTDWTTEVNMHPPRLIGVADGLFNYMRRITGIRNTIRTNMMANSGPVVDYESLYHASEIDAGIRAWMPHWPPGDSRDRVSLLYKQTMWVYLFQTVYPPSDDKGLPTPWRSDGVVRMTALDAHVPPSPVSSSVDPHTGELRRHSCPSPSTSASGSHDVAAIMHRTSSSRPASMHGDGTLDGFHTHSQTSSPPPAQHPSVQDARVAVAVGESIAVIESFKPSDPSQTLLLMPCLVLGTACVNHRQQDRIRAAVRCVKGYTGLRNSDLVLEVLEEVWRLMARGEWIRAWDWQGVSRGMGLEFLCA